MIVVINNVSDNLPHRSACYRLSQFLLVGLVGLIDLFSKAYPNCHSMQFVVADITARGRPVR